MALVVAMGFVGVNYHRQIHSYLTHWKGSPKGTVVYTPFASPPELRMAVAGDIGDSGSRLELTARAIDRLTGTRPFDDLLLLGDNVYPSGDPARLPATVFEPFGPVLAQGTRLLAILGNHDVKQNHADAQMAALGMPGRWWTVRAADVQIIGLDSNEPGNAEQRAFLEQTLATTDARWKVVALHHPPYSAGYQGSSMSVRKALVPLFERYGVQLVLSGHDHDYQRSKVINGVTYIVSGGASGTRRTGTKSFTAVSFSWHHFVELGFFHDRIEGRAVNQKDRIADSWTITSGAATGGT